MGWHGELRIAYERVDEGSAQRTRAHAEHSGPYRVLKALYPEGPGICHHVLLHPPSGLVGGDTLALDLELAGGSHAVITTPGASRFYRSEGEEASQRVHARIADGARLEWLPRENIVGTGALAINHQRFELAPGAQMMGWDLLALGLPAADAPFVAGRFTQHLELPGLWLERAVMAADDHLLLESRLGLQGRRAMATLWWACGAPPAAGLAERAVELAREVIKQASSEHADAPLAGVSCVHPQVVVLRALAQQIEPLAQLLNAARRAWRHALWGLQAHDPRVWST